MAPPGQRLQNAAARYDLEVRLEEVAPVLGRALQRQLLDGRAATRFVLLVHEDHRLAVLDRRLYLPQAVARVEVALAVGWCRRCKIVYLECTRCTDDVQTVCMCCKQWRAAGVLLECEKGTQCAMPNLNPNPN